MAETTTPGAQARPEYPAEQQKQQRFLLWHRLALGGIFLISIFMNFFQLGENGFASYYPPAIRSMMDNWHNFFFASYDPGGFVAVDKPPLGFWFDVLSAKIFGFNAVSILLPQALAGVLSVLLLYALVRRHFGVMAGLLAGLALAVTPISVVTNRDITIDSILALFLLVGAWAVLRAAETGRLRWLLLSAFMVGLGFNIKMLEAYLVVPAFAVLYLVAAPRSIWKRLAHLALAGLLLLLVSFCWIEAVDLTPASQRPYIDSTQDDSELSLALGYNGISRLLGPGRSNGTLSATPSSSQPGAKSTPSTHSSSSSQPGAKSTPSTHSSSSSQPGAKSTPQASSSNSPNAAPGGLFNTGSPGPLRLFQESLGSQIGWLLPLALLGLLALAWQGRPRVRENYKLQALLFWGMWLFTMGIFFSVAGFFHQYYLTEMAPGLAALVGIGLVTMWHDYQQKGWRGWLLPVALIATVAEQVYLLTAYPGWDSWMIPLIGVLSLLTIALLLRIRPQVNAVRPYLLYLVLGIGLTVLLFAPTVWSITPILLSNASDTLLAGPPQGGGSGGGFIVSVGSQTFTGSIPASAVGSDNTITAQSRLVRYLEAKQGQTTFLVATPNSQGAADQLILATNRPVMAMGGFSNDPILTTSQLATLIKHGTVRFFLLPTNGRLPPQLLDQLSAQAARQLIQAASPGQGPLTTWVMQHCQAVPASLWQSPSPTGHSGSTGTANENQLYDCITIH
ncbi:putative mannosyltransferase YycA [Ktedonobacteria bacterium brp13]|nr:putative mannosyltransferase YycA [Ktedonobacteria bacterium brp13]